MPNNLSLDYTKNGWKIQTLDIAFLLFGAVITFLIWILPSATAERLTVEDGYIENVTSLFYLVAIVWGSTCVFRQKPKHRMYLILWIVLSFLFFGEEISWGQRVFGFATPESLSSNVQGEANIHNLPFLTPRIVDNPTDLITSQGLFYLGFLFYFFAAQLAMRLPIFDRLAERLNWPQLSIPKLAAIWIPIFFSFGLAVITKFGPTREALTETRELQFAASICFYVLVLTMLGSRKSEGAPLAVALS